MLKRQNFCSGLLWKLHANNFKVSELSDIFFPACTKKGSMISKDTSITSPFYPDYYPFNQLCIWNITNQNNKYIRLKLKDVDLGRGDAIAMGNELTMNRNYQSNNVINKWLTVCQGSSELKFTSDNSGFGTGFKADIKFHQPPSGKWW